MDLSVMASQVRSAHTALPVFTCNDHIIELVLNKNFAEEWPCYLDSQSFYLVLEGSLTFYAGAGKSFEVNAGEYVMVEAGSPFMLKDQSGCNYLSIHKRSYNKVSHPPLDSTTVERHGNFEKDLRVGGIKLNNHQLNLVSGNNFQRQEALIDSDRAIFVMKGEMYVADSYGEDTILDNEIVNIPGHTFHRLFASEGSLGFILQRENAKIALLDASN